MTSCKEVVYRYLDDHPNATITECRKELGISESTVDKWRKAYLAEKGITVQTKEQVVYSYIKEHPDAKIMQMCEDLGLNYRTVRKYTDKYYGRYQSVTHIITDYDPDDEDFDWDSLEDIPLYDDESDVNDILPDIEHCKDGGYRLSFSIKIRPKELTPQKRTEYEAKVSKEFPVPLMPLDGETYTLLFSANEAYAMLDGIKALKKDRQFISSTLSFIVYDKIEDIQYRIIG